MALTLKTQQLVARIITTQALSIRETEVQKEVLAQDPAFVALNAFQRIDCQKKRQINTLDLCSFFRDNKLVVNEADCYMLVKQFDSNHDGFLSLIDLMMILCPRTYTYSRNFRATKRQVQYGRKDVALSYAVEFAVVQVL